MAGVRFNRAIGCAVGINLLLLTIGTILRATLQPARIFNALSDTNGTEHSTSNLIPSTLKKEREITMLKTTKNINVEFIRKKWGEPFSPGKESVFDSWRFLLPKSSSQRPDFVLGIPTISRQGHSYLENTLNSLIHNLGNYRDAVIVVYIGEEDEAVASEISASIQRNFSTQLKEGLIQIIVPPADYYPDWNSALPQNFGDPFQRVKWRSKQVLDQIFLMMYAYYMDPKYYLMLEDDVIASNEYLSKIFLDAESKAETNFVLISYCQLGAIGKLFRRELLPSIATHFCLFWSDKPLDWLLLDYMRTRVCDYSKNEKDCSNKVKEIEIVHKPSLFQHVGTTSSFPGKIQKLKDKSFKPV